MRIINWNISWSNKTDNKAAYLRSIIDGKSFVVILQEVKMFAYEALKQSLGDIANIEYSLDYRIPGKFDTDSRKLGVAIFIMITGYFLIDKKIDYKKLIKLELQVLFYSIILYFSISSIAGYTYNQKEMVNAFIPNITKIYWFYSGYFIITILSPYLSKLLNNLTKLEYLKLLLTM